MNPISKSIPICRMALASAVCQWQWTGFPKHGLPARTLTLQTSLASATHRFIIRSFRASSLIRHSSLVIRYFAPSRACASKNTTSPPPMTNHKSTNASEIFRRGFRAIDRRESPCFPVANRFYQSTFAGRFTKNFLPAPGQFPVSSSKNTHFSSCSPQTLFHVE
jgi:hypothetical protein